VQDGGVGVRVASVEVDPVRPDFGARFDVHLTLRVAPGFVLVLPDSLLPSDAVSGVGFPEGRSEAPAAGDSVDVSVTYPAIALDAGLVDLPALEIELQPLGITQELDLGAVSIASFVWPGGVDEIPQARPARDVIGGSWSVWDALVASMLTIALALGAGPLASHVAERRRAARALAEWGTPRERALKELQRLRSLTWDRAGGVAEFYGACTAALRRYWADTEPRFGLWLTSGELVSRLSEDERSPEFPRDVEVAVRNAEQAKFGNQAPPSDTADKDWGTIHGWITALPEQ
jgi:hypothetical protein